MVNMVYVMKTHHDLQFPASGPGVPQRHSRSSPASRQQLGNASKAVYLPILRTYNQNDRMCHSVASVARLHERSCLGSCSPNM